MKFSQVKYLYSNLTKQYISFWLCMHYIYRDFGIIKSEIEGEEPSRVPKRNLESPGIEEICISPIKRVRISAYDGSMERPDEPFTEEIN